jgi:HSP20 family protein
MTLMRRDPFSETVPLREAIDRIFEESFLRPGEWLSRSARSDLALDVYETGDKLVVKAALPGIKPEDVDITIDGSTLAIKGEYKAEEVQKENQYHRRELRSGSFERVITLPDRFQTEKAEASFENGLLTLTIPKAEQAMVKHIKVQPRTSESVMGAIKR